VTVPDEGNDRTGGQ